MNSTDTTETSSTLLNRRILISGSANYSTDASLIYYAHDLIRHLTDGILRRGGRLIVGAGKEPKQSDDADAPALLFDWTVLDAAAAYLSGEGSFLRLKGPPITCAISEKGESEIPADRAGLWDSLRQDGFLEVEYIQPGARSGAMIRDRQAQLSEVLLVLGGGSGVEHLADKFAERRLPVIAFDLNLGASRDDGTGGGLRIARLTKANPAEYFRLQPEYQSTAGALYSLLSTIGSPRPTTVLARTAIDLIEKLEKPKVFYTRLLNREIEAFSRVENFFRNVVDLFVDTNGYHRHEVGFDRLEQPFINLAIFENLHYASVVVADLTAERNNCYMELGYALGRPIKVLMTAEEGTKLPFDPNAIPCHFWSMRNDPAMELERLGTFWRTNIDRPPLIG